MARKIVSLFLSIMILTSLSCQAFALEEAAQRPEDGGNYWVSGSASLAKYDKDWNLVLINDDPFKGYDMEVNHIADIDVYENELYIGAEYFMDGVGKNIQIAVYDGDTLELKRTFPFEAESGQLECSGIAVDPDTKSVWMCSWVGEESGRYLYRYDLETGAYLGKVHMQMPPQWLQGVAYFNGCLYMTADDGTADDNEPDHLYRAKITEGCTYCTVTLERTFDDVTKQGEIEGLTFDKEANICFFCTTEARESSWACRKAFMTAMTGRFPKCLSTASPTKESRAAGT